MPESVILEISENNIKKLYSGIESLDYAWRGTLVNYVSQYLFIYHALNDNGGEEISKRFLERIYRDTGLDIIVKRIVNASDSFCYRCGFKSTMTDIDEVILDEGFRQLLELRGLIEQECECVLPISGREGTIFDSTKIGG